MTGTRREGEHDRPIKIWFTDFWEGFDPQRNFLMYLLRARFEVQLDTEADCLIYSVFGEEHRKFDCARVLYSGENIRPDYAVCDYAFTYDHDASPRHLRWPMYALYGHYLELLELPRAVDAILAAKTGFCCMVVSNSAAPERIRLCEQLCQYRQVDSGGRLMNNVGGPVADKLAFLRDYKFNLCYENSCYPGYTTEKLVEALVSGCIPIYWGNPRVGEDFNTGAFVNRHDFDSDEAMIEHIIRIDRDEDLYRHYLGQPVFGPEQTDWRSYAPKVAEKFEEIFADARAGIHRRADG